MSLHTGQPLVTLSSATRDKSEMRRFAAYFCFLSACACSGFIFADDVELTRDKTMDGTWRADISGSQSVVLVISGSNIEMHANAGEKRLPIWSGKMTISKENPDSHMDWTELVSGQNKLPDNRCLFRFRGDTLLVIGGGPDRRPTRFFSGPGAEPKALLFIRIEGTSEKAEQDPQPKGR